MTAADSAPWSSGYDGVTPVATEFSGAVPNAAPTCCTVLYAAGATPASIGFGAAVARLVAAAGRRRRDQYPTVTTYDHIADDDWDASFAAGLKVLLAGIEARTKR
ncbi:hypothetical protein KUF83_19220 [Streptomyces sp. BV286]|uniref:hypothetical protein n=1 Tax=Streptomyces sp. BV286 TaxID=2849672 RepID=UPI001C2F087E|nr:hypothetical protein [Streptomyces sp. BV286]MBV1938677.1 hypothetical protein [Streptomyces sp. BV286]